ncbi:hypothetical protein U0X36_25850 [Bacillus thuringiensis]|uniref:hypothetical protein n=1 Tax=Bacillus thuringiensis TaxID=1428 RepID=UPI000E481B8D|nr:hypothetical protein [Bacillus thuringiensis]MDZ3956238.1 hypothetical protein [Bacillus thuringiensis]RGP43346.1 hypothetical protein BTW32_29950 [Bacillus thuringiensis]
MKTKITSYKLTSKSKKLLNTYAEQLKTRKAKIITYGIFEMLVKQQLDPKKIADYIEKNTFVFLKDRPTILMNMGHFESVCKLKKEVEKITGKDLYDNEFLGILILYYFEKVAFYHKKKTIKELTTNPINCTQVGFYINSDLKAKLVFLCDKYSLTNGLLLFDILTDQKVGKLPLNEFPSDIEIESDKKEKITVFIPDFAHDNLNNLPLTNSFVVEIRSEKFLDIYSLN